MARLIVAPQAQADLDDILDYLTREASDPVACPYGDSFRGAFAFLTALPRTGAPRPNFGATMRIKTVWPYIIFYRYSAGNDTVRLIRIPRRDLRLFNRLAAFWRSAVLCGSHGGVRGSSQRTFEIVREVVMHMLVTIVSSLATGLRTKGCLAGAPTMSSVHKQAFAQPADGPADFHQPCGGHRPPCAPNKAVNGGRFPPYLTAAAP